MDRFVLNAVQEDLADLNAHAEFEAAVGAPFISTDDWAVITEALAELAAA